MVNREHIPRRKKANTVACTVPRCDVEATAHLSRGIRAKQAGISRWVDYIDFDSLLFREMTNVFTLSRTSRMPTVLSFAGLPSSTTCTAASGSRTPQGLIGTETARCKITNCVGRGTSKSFIRMDGVSQWVLIEDFDFDGDRQSGDNFAEGIHLNGPGSELGHDVRRQ